MSLSLEVKKFVNSESMGDFVTVLLPGEVPTDSAEIRAMNRERAAAQRAAKEALELAEDEALAKSDADEAKKALDEAKAALAEHDKALDEQKKEHDKLRSEHGKKKEALDRAKKALDDMTAEEAKLSAALSAAKSAFSDSEKAKSEAKTALSELKKAAEAEAKEKAEKPANTEKNEKPSKEASAEEKPLEEKADKPEQADKKQGAEADAASQSTEEKADEKAEAKTEETPEKSEKAEEAEKTEEAAKAEEAEKPEAEKKLSLPEAEKAFEAAKSAHEKAKSELDSVENKHKTAEENAKKRLSEHEKLSAEFTQLSTFFESASASLELAREERNAVSEQVKALERSNADAASKLSEAHRAHEAAVKESERLKGAVRTLKTEHESASMHYLESGKGETLLLIHTAGQSLFTFRSIFYKLAMNYHVVAVDLMGHGCSDRPDYFDYSTASHAESLVSFMDALGIEQAHLLGFSMGAGYALELARRYPARVMSVVALSPGGVTGAMPLPVRMMESALFGGIASKLFRLKTVEKLLDECLFDHTVIGPHEVGEYYKSASDGEGRRAIRLTVSSFGEKELLASLEDIKTPVLVVSSDKDRWHSIEQVEAYANALENADFIVMRNAGHLLHEEKPDRTVELVRSFIPAGYGDYDGRELP
ncbi:MAG: alpha/beta fold hydrolase [Clostridia bacterium]|nr:alpha/beta fold hydrolase [Clostridia bacterium]